LTRRPFDVWESYLDSGWVPLPLPPKDKFPPPSGWTGGAKAHSGKVPKKTQYKTWGKEGYGVHKAGNIAVRVPRNVIGIDVDMYDGKHGRDTLAEHEQLWGKLPSTWTSTSRTDGSGIRFFTVPEGLSWASRVGGEASGIEIVRWDHRYAVVWPSVHPSGGTYGWLSPSGVRESDNDWFPAISELIDLPERWVDGLTSGRQEWVEREEAELTPDEVLAWLDKLHDAEGEICLELSGTVARAIAEFSTDGVAIHEAGLSAVWGVLRDGAHGHTGCRRALREVRDAFFGAAERRGRGRLAQSRGEWFRLLGDGVRKVAAEIRVSAEDSCAAFGDFKFNPTRAVDVPGQMYGLTDIGNAQRFVALYGEDVRWYEAEGRWVIWNGSRWVLDRVGAVESMGKQVAEWIEHSEAPKFDGDNQDWFKALKAHAKALGRRGSRLSMLDDAKSARGVSLVPEQVNADARLLQCGTRLVRLGENGAAVRLPLREDYQTLSTAVDYDAGATSEIWDQFLKKFIPDPDVRRWLQKAVGYSLRGGNPERKLFILQGRTSTGKSTFIEAIGSALGEYAASFEITLFRSQKEQGPNVQLVRLLSKRLIFTTETSAERYLHADTMKRMAGNDRMSSRLIRSNDLIDKTPQFTPWLAVNEMATVRGADAALSRRLICVPFEEQMSEDEIVADFLERLMTEARPAILAWAIEGWTMYAQEGLGDLPLAVVTATMRLRGELSEIDMWMTEECEQEGDATESTENLYRAYVIWAEDAGIKDVENKIAFAKTIANKLGQSPSRVVVGRKRLRGFTGIGLRKV
jgi:putative DNA primase/helicase